MILWRPVGLHEMALIFDGGMKCFPPRLPHQPIFYPVLVEDYANQIAGSWNTKEPPFAGYVVEFAISDDYASRFAPHTVGSSLHRELWVPSEELTEFNAQITNTLLVRRAFFGSGYRGMPIGLGLPGSDAFEQIARMMNTMEHPARDFGTEVSANSAALFLNFPFWKAAGAKRFGLDSGRFTHCLDQIRLAWTSSVKPAALVEEAIYIP